MLTSAEVEALIRQAFRGVKLGDGIGLFESQAIDHYGSAEERRLCRARDETEDWSRISDHDLIGCQSSLSFFDPEGFRFHIPAYITSDLRVGWVYLRSSVESVVLGNGDVPTGHRCVLSEDQVEALRQYLMYDYRNDVDEALDSFRMRRRLCPSGYLARGLPIDSSYLKVLNKLNPDAYVR